MENNVLQQLKENIAKVMIGNERISLFLISFGIPIFMML